jgi:hypothetical protein
VHLRRVVIRRPLPATLRPRRPRSRGMPAMIGGGGGSQVPGEGSGNPWGTVDGISGASSGSMRHPMRPRPDPHGPLNPARELMVTGRHCHGNLEKAHVKRSTASSRGTISAHRRPGVGRRLWHQAPRLSKSNGFSAIHSKGSKGQRLAKQVRNVAARPAYHGRAANRICGCGKQVLPRRVQDDA